MFYKRRKTVQQDLEAVGRGEDLWTSLLSNQVRHRILFAVKDLVQPDLCGPYVQYNAVEVAHGLVIRDIGVPNLSYSNHDWDLDFFSSILESTEDIVYSQIEALHLVVRNYSRDHYRGNQDYVGEFERAVNTALREAWVQCELVGGQFVDLDSLELHSEVVVPALTLLGSDPRFAPSERAYRAALKEIHEGSPENAVTDASTAVQEMLISLGAKGNTVSKAIVSAIGSGLLTSYDKNLGSWIEADRSGMGDAHNSRPATVEDAWLIVHVAGALIVRLSKGTGRDSSA